jgi:ankyrin repeat protein
MKRERGDNAGGEDAQRKKEEASDRLLEACKQKGGDVEAARQAIDDGANVDVREGLWFPLLYAADPAFGNNLEIVQMLIDAGCDLNQVDENGWTALNWVPVNGGKVSIVEALLRAGADPDIANNNGNTMCENG